MKPLLGKVSQFTPVAVDAPHQNYPEVVGEQGQHTPAHREKN